MRHANDRIDVDTLPFAISVRLRRIVRLASGWRLWIDTADFKHGTFYDLADNGRVVRFVVRVGEGDEVMQVRPSNAELIREIE